MTKDEHNALLNELKTCTSDADRMGIIVKLEQDYTGVLNEVATATEKATTAENEANKWAKLNNQLWLENSAQKKVGQDTKGETETGTGTEGEEPPKKHTYEDLEKEF
jgi:hypothetical protein